MIKTYDYNDDTQLSAHFNAREFRCKCGQAHPFKVDPKLIINLENLFMALNCSKIVITSGYRCANHDRAVGGNGSGQHTVGTAADFTCYGEDGNQIDSKYVCCAMQDIGFKGIANINSSRLYVHGDMRENGKWYGDETVSYNTVTDDFYKYYGIKKEDDDMGSKKNGIDISYCQTNVDWNKVDAEFVIVRAGYGKLSSQKDNMFEKHYAGAKSRGIPVGAYWYSYAMSPSEAEQEADACIEVLQGKQFEYPIFYDVEEKKQLALGKEKVSEIIVAFLSKMEKAGYWVGLYGSYTSLTNLTVDSIRARYAIWLAHWNVEESPYKGAYGLWQYKVGNASGVSGDCDLDYSYEDYPTMIKARGLNGFGQSDKNTDNNEIVKSDDNVDSASVISVQTTGTPSAAKNDTIDISVDINGKTYKGTLKAQ